MPIKSKLPNVKTTIFTTVGKMAKQHNALNLSQGFPNFEPDQHLLDLVTKALNEGHNQYAHMAGLPKLREVITNKILTLHHREYNPETEITVTNGASQAIFTAITAFVEPGDEVIVFKPAYDCYEPAIEVNGGSPVYLQLNQNFKVDWEVFRNKITQRTKMVIVNTPHNPSGTIFSKEDMLELQKSLKDTNIIVISDEVYEHIVFDGYVHESASRFDDLASRSFICASFGKTFHVTGWKVGYCVAPAELMHEFRKTHQFNVFCVDHPLQHALSTYLQEPQHYLNLNNFYQKKRDLFLNGLKGSRFEIAPSKGTYFQLLGYSKITDESDVDFAKRLIIEYKLASIPISVFNVGGQDNKVLRFCFAKTNDTLEQATEILKKL
ncbi:methionine aminotransferase [Maribacter sp. HTCC2170]|uniref:methionine aminotransferase n=1 Tax=Maribacter sp. (strain HTCC2170 / KCCM 42371) TaxID=313603 RepID=UPI00006BD41D|nr:methionine aminotransferase [Maribacter sp. HTCC2170]EAR02701.1 putative aminotransferase [Maribacter sp. HTCC2170]